MSAKNKEKEIIEKNEENIETKIETNKNTDLKSDIFDINKITYLNNNIVRKISKTLTSTFNLDRYKGFFYYNIHLYMIFVILFITLFTTSINYLLIVLLIVSLDALAIVCLHQCPLTIMERKYLGNTSMDDRNNMFKCAGIMYNCDHDYEKQIELLINVWSTITLKCCSILFIKMFNIKLFDVSNIYLNS